MHHKIEQDNFASVDEFENWKRDIEKSSHTYFVKHCGDKRRTDKNVSYYYCNRSGTQRAKIAQNERKRHMKTHSKEKPYKCQQCSYKMTFSEKPMAA